MAALVSDAAPAESDDLSLDVIHAFGHVWRRIRSSHLRLQLLRAMPASTPHLANARRRLARASFFHLDHYPREPLDLAAVIKYLESNALFNVGPRTDYTHLAAQASILDIAIGDGGYPLPTGDDDVDAKARKAFDKKVDKLADDVQSLAARIIDTGAAHLTRTEAKEVLQAMHTRLLYGVRTRPRPKKSLFSSADEEREGERAMEKFLKGQGIDSQKTTGG